MCVRVRKQDCELVLECVRVCICTVGLSSVNAIIKNATDGLRQSVQSRESGKVEGFLFCFFGSFVFSILAVFPDWLTAGLVERMSFLGPGPSQTNL